MTRFGSRGRSLSTAAAVSSVWWILALGCSRTDSPAAPAATGPVPAAQVASSEAKPSPPVASSAADPPPAASTANEPPKAVKAAPATPLREPSPDSPAVASAEAAVAAAVDALKAKKAAKEPASKPATPASSPPVPGAPPAESPPTGVPPAAAQPTGKTPPTDEAAPTAPQDSPDAASMKPKTLTTQAIVNAVDDAVVYITAQDALGQTVALGTGCVIHRDGLVVTNFHVLEQAASAFVQFRDGGKFDIAGYRAVDSKNDLVILQLRDKPASIDVLELNRPGDLEQGSPVVAIGHPNDFKFTVTTGIVSAVRKTSELPGELQQVLRASADTLWIQTNAAASNGSSGGPLLDGNSGQFLGVMTWLVPGANMAFAIHARHVCDLYEHLSGELGTLPLPGTEVIVDPQVARIVGDFGSEYQQLVLELRQATEQAQQLRLLQERNPTPACLKRLRELAAEHPGEPVAFEALLAACRIARGTDKRTASGLVKVLDQLRADFPNEPRLDQVCMALMQAPVVAEPYLRGLLRSHDRREVRGLACFALAVVLAQADANVNQRVADLVELLQRIQDNFADVQLGGDSLGTLTKNDLFRFQHLTIGRKAAEIQGPDADGQPLSLHAQRGKVVVLDFWANWCPHCRVMYADERAMVNRHAGQPFALLGVNSDQDAAQAKSLRQAGTVTWPSWLDGADGPIGKQWQVSSIPTTYVLDQQGVIRYSQLRGKQLDDAVQTLLDDHLRDPPGDLIARGAVWKYLDDDMDQGDAWRQLDFADAAWREGASPLGFGLEVEATRLESGQADSRPVTTYFRKAFEVADPAAVKQLILRFHVNDGGVVYLNGIEVQRENLPAPATHDTTAIAEDGANWWDGVWSAIDPQLLKPGRNVLAVEVHQSSVHSADLHFDLSLSTALPDLAAVAASTSSAIREELCTMLWRLSPRINLTQAIVPLLQDPEPFVRCMAAVALLTVDPAWKEPGKLPAAQGEQETQFRQLMGQVLNAKAWPLVESSQRTSQQIERGLGLARAARWLTPQSWEIANTLGVAEYRAGLHRDAIASLQASLQLRGPNPHDLAFIAMSQHRLGDREQAAQQMQKVRELIKEPAWSADEDVLESVQEAEALLSGGSP